MIENLQEVFEKFDKEYLKFKDMENKRSQRPDLHAFLLLDSLVPGTRDIVSDSEHDEIWLEVSAEELAKVASDCHILELVRCGVRYDENTECLAMFT